MHLFSEDLGRSTHASASIAARRQTWALGRRLHRPRGGRSRLEASYALSAAPAHPGDSRLSAISSLSAHGGMAGRCISDRCVSVVRLDDRRREQLRRVRNRWHAREHSLMGLSVEEETHEEVGEPVLKAFDRPAGVLDESQVGVGCEHPQGVGDRVVVVAQSVRLAGER
jgi:hypothetical protein